MIDVEMKIKKRNKILFTRDSQCLHELVRLIDAQDHRTLVMWALDCAQLPLEQLEARYPDERRPGMCLELCAAWARGEIKMPLAKRAILDLHDLAKAIDQGEYAALCHAIGHAGATVHVQTHALGLPLYELTAIVLKCGQINYEEPVISKIDYYCQRLRFWQANTDQQELKWAGFIK